MNTLTITSKAALTLARATEKASRLKPRVRKTAEYRVYEVEASDKSKWYTVKCVSATKEITCNCKALKGIVGNVKLIFSAGNYRGELNQVAPNRV
jgi:hypothetical protein